MATNKNQHFVPRCYLRPFTVNTDGLAINLYNIDRQKLIPNAPVKNQCSGNYFYGQDDLLEKAIQMIEGEYAGLLQRVCKPSYVLTDNDKNTFRMFWLFQHLRTESAAKTAVAMSNNMAEVIGLTGSYFRIQIKEAVMVAIRAFAENMHILDDLKVCLIKNKTNIPFITSDDPAVLTNKWWLTDNRTKGRSFGLTSAGNIFLLPITPKLLCIGYDGDVYSIPHKAGTIDIRDEKDIASFNQHQLLNCRANLFVHDVAYSEYINNTYLKFANLRPATKHLFNYAVLDGFDGTHKRYRVVNSKDSEEHTEAIIHTQTIHPVPSSWPRQITLRNKGKVYTNGSGLGYVRYKTTMQPTENPFHKEST